MLIKRLISILIVIATCSVAVSSKEKVAEPIARAVLSSKTVYVGQPLVCTLQLLVQDGNITYLSPLRNPDFRPFRAQQIGRFTSGDKTEKVKGKQYQVIDFATYLLWPDKPGEYKLPEIDVVVGKSSERIVNDMFWGPMRRSFTEKTTVKTKSVSYKVKALPPSPSDFCGAIGEFELMSYFPEGGIRKYETSEIIYRITGSGNLENLKFPDIREMMDNDVKILSAEELQTEVYLENGVLKSKREIVVRFLPEKEGNIKFPAIKLMYFDTATGKYRYMNSDAETITVGKSKVSKSDTPMYDV